MLMLRSSLGPGGVSGSEHLNRNRSYRSSIRSHTRRNTSITSSQQALKPKQQCFKANGVQYNPAEIHDTELVGNNPSQKNWRGIVIALLVILIVCSLIALAIVLVAPTKKKAESKRPDTKNKPLKDEEKFSFENLFSTEYQPKHFPHTWSGDHCIYKSRDGDIFAYDAPRSHNIVLMPNKTYKQIAIDRYEVSADLLYILLAYQVTPIYRHSYTARYKIYVRDQPANEERLVNFPNSESGEWDDVELQYAGWASQGHGLVFIHQNNIYYQDDPASNPVKISDTGETGLVFNGAPDWLYEEEILGSAKAHWWSPDGRYLSYLEIDDNNVPRYKFTEYGEYDVYYPSMRDVAYPKAGDIGNKINPTVRLHITEPASEDHSAVTIAPPTELVDKDHYILNVKWLDESRVLVTWANRVQNHSVVTLCTVQNPSNCHKSVEEMKHNGWVTMSEPWVLGGDRDDYYLMIMSKRDRNNYWRHIARISTPENGPAVRAFLTQGQWDVTRIVGTDSQYVYFLGSGGNFTDRHLYRAHLDRYDQMPECRTCGQTDDCRFYDASFSKQGQFYVLGCLGPSVPYYTMRSIIDSRDIPLEDNKELVTRLAKKALPTRDFYEIEVDGGHKVGISLLLPPIVIKDKSHITQYPLLVHVYGGPGSQKVTQEFDLSWFTYLSSAENVIVANVDGRGTRNRGENFLHAVYRRLGTVEVQDQLAAVKFLTRKLRYVDKERKAMWGWSYGGFVTAHALGDRSDVIPCGIAVAPVTDWRYYDTAYTERYMRLASDPQNFQGYDHANVSAKAKEFKDKKFMIVHGTSDDNVHFQNSAQLIKALTHAEVTFRSQIYTDQNHAIAGTHTSRHLYKTMTKFLKKECWTGGEPRDVRTEDLPDMS